MCFIAEDVWPDLEGALGSAGQVIVDLEVGHPHIKAKGEPELYSIFAEGTEIIEVRGIETALLAYIATHSIFNLKFGRGARGFGVYLQKQLGIDDGMKMNSKAIRFAKLS